MTLPLVQIAGAAQTARLKMSSQLAMRDYGDIIRTDSRKSADIAVDEQRRLIRHYAHTQCRMVATLGEQQGRRIDAKELTHRERDVVGAICDGLGLRNDDGTMRNDASSFLPGELTTSTGRTIIQPEQRRALLETIPRVAVDAWAQNVSDDYLGYTGAADIARPGQTSYPRADYAVAQDQQQMHTIETSTMMGWMEAMFGARSAINGVQRKAEAARKAIEKYLEAALSGGVPGMSFKGLIDLSAPEYYSTVDYTPGAGGTVATFYDDLVAAVQLARQASDYRGMQVNAMWAGPRFLDALMPVNNFSAGGSMSGADLRAKLLADLGIRTVIEATSLEGWKGQANRDGVVFGRSEDDEGIRQFVGLDAAPMRRATDLSGDHTLWVARHGGLNLASAVHTAFASFQVRA